MEAMQAIALKLLENGFTPLHISPDGKMPKAKGWQHDIPTEESLNRAFARPSNIGVRMGDTHKDDSSLIAIDIDIEDFSLLRCVQFAIGDERAPVKRGKKGHTFIVRMDREIKTHKIYWTRDGGKKTPCIDVLAKGAQTVIPPSIHPETKLPYQWIGCKPLEEWNYQELPILTPTVLDEIRGFCKNEADPIYALNDMEWLGVGGGGNTHDVCLTAVASMVARKWPEKDIHERIQRAKQEACERAGTPYNWPKAEKTIQEWIDSSKSKDFETTTKQRIDDVPLHLIDRYAYVTQLDCMFDLKQSVPLKMQQINNLHSRDVAKPWSTLQNHPDFRKVDRLTYAPGQPRICKEPAMNNNEERVDCVNTYYNPHIEPTEGDVEPFLTLVNELFDYDKAAIHHVLSFLSCVVQRPGERINHGLIIQGEQGIGKDTLVHTMERVLGAQNVSQVSLDMVESTFNQWLFGKQLIVFQEMLATGRRGIYNKLKPYITAPTHNVNVKNLPLQTIPNRAAYIFLTNYKHALSIDLDDRRCWVWFSKMKGRPKDYYNSYYEWLNKLRTPSHLMHFLQNYDLGDWDPMAKPPMTDSKLTMIETSSSECEQYLREAARDGRWPMTCDLVSASHLVSAIRPVMRTSVNIVNEALDHLCSDGSLLDSRPRFPNGQRLRLRAIRNLPKWSKALGPALAEAYRMPTPPGLGESEGGYTMFGGGASGDDDPGY